jgi:hypothetical protein
MAKEENIMPQFEVIREVRGRELLKEVREILREMKLRGFRVPRIEATGTWSLSGFEIELEDAENVLLPLGKRYVRFEGKPTLAATKDSVVTIYSVAEGRLIEGEAADETNLLDLIPDRKKK